MRLAIGLIALLSGCSSSSPDMNVPGAAAPVTSGASPRANPAPPETEASTLEVREGKLFTSKGNPAVADVLLPHEPIKERFGPDWYRTAVGKRIRVRGKLHVHHCGLQEQCLTSGEIPILTPESIELLDAPEASADPDLLAKCLEECEERSHECDKLAAADRGRLRICGSRRVQCRSECQSGKGL